jgi:4-phospho-D-threonate 3-dehydrogenase / 4-phospho-D-erythronate 3-dehydrogenase
VGEITHYGPKNALNYVLYNVVFLHNNHFEIMHTENKPVIGISCGDVNGIGLEIIIKTVGDSRLLEICTPVIFASNKVLNFYRKGLPDINFNFMSIKDVSRINHKQVNLFNCWEEDVAITPGQLTDIGGKYAVQSLVIAAQALKDGKIDGLVTAPIHKKNTQSTEFNFTGHTPYLKNLFGVSDVAMFMVADNMKVGLVTEHVAVKDVAQYITRENILSKLNIINNSLKKEFGIEKPKIAVLALNPHAGDEGLIGKEEEDIIKPTIKEAKQKDIFCFGPYSADAFFARGYHEKFDAVLAMYHDQGLIPFKSLAIGEGVNFTAGISGVRTSPDHGVAFDIAGKDKADESSFRHAIFTCVDIIKSRQVYEEQRKNPLRKISQKMVANAVDENITEVPE